MTNKELLIQLDNQIAALHPETPQGWKAAWRLMAQQFGSSSEAEWPAYRAALQPLARNRPQSPDGSTALPPRCVTRFMPMLQAQRTSELTGMAARFMIEHDLTIEQALHIARRAKALIGSAETSDVYFEQKRAECRADEHYPLIVEYAKDSLRHSKFTGLLVRRMSKVINELAEEKL